MSGRAEGILDDAENLAACALELAIVDHKELDEPAQLTHAITALLLSASDLSIKSGITAEQVEDYMLSFLRIALAMRRQGLN